MAADDARDQRIPVYSLRPTGLKAAPDPPYPSGKDGGNEEPIAGRNKKAHSRVGFLMQSLGDSLLVARARFELATFGL